MLLWIKTKFLINTSAEKKEIKNPTESSGKKKKKLTLNLQDSTPFIFSLFQCREEEDNLSGSNTSKYRWRHLV